MAHRGQLNHNLNPTIIVHSFDPKLKAEGQAHVKSMMGNWNVVTNAKTMNPNKGSSMAKPRMKK